MIERIAKREDLEWCISMHCSVEKFRCAVWTFFGPGSKADCIEIDSELTLVGIRLTTVNPNAAVPAVVSEWFVNGLIAFVKYICLNFVTKDTVDINENWFVTNNL